MTATNTARATFEFDLRDNDNQTDNLSFGTAIAAAVGPTLVKIYGFDGTASGTANADRLNTTALGSMVANQTSAALSAQTAADLIGAALGDTVGSGAVSVVMNTTTATADFTWSYQGDVYLVRLS